MGGPAGLPLAPIGSASLPDDEVFRVFNMGIGLVLVVADYYAEAIARYLRTEAGVPAWVIGEVVAGDRSVRWEG